MSAPRMACIWFPNWPIQRLVVAQPQRRRTLLVLYREIGGRGRMVAAASPLALRNGVRPGMPLAEAKSLVRRAQQRRTAAQASPVREPAELPADPTADREALQQLARRLHAFSPLVGILDRDDADSLLCDVSGVAELFGGEEAWIAHVLASLHRRDDTDSVATPPPSSASPEGDAAHHLGYTASIAIADTVGQAWALAVHGSRPAVIAPPGACWEWLDALPPEALRLSPEICQTMAQLGITSIGQLRRLPRASLASRFGDAVARRMDQASGARPEPIVAVPLLPTFAAEQWLEFPAREWETVLTVIERLTERICAELQRTRQGALAWRLQLWRQHAPVLHARIGLFAPLAAAAQLMPLVRMQLEQWGAAVNDDEEAVTEIAVAAEQITPLVEYQPSLFDAGAGRANQAAWGDLINRLAIRLGADRVVAPRCVASAQPELAFRYEPLVGRQMPRRPARPAQTPGPLRPIRLFPQPVPIEVVATAAGPPTVIVCREQRWTIARYWGPERIETGWWRAPLVRRDYWRVETSARHMWWIYRDLKTGNWFWHGAF